MTYLDAGPLQRLSCKIDMYIGLEVSDEIWVRIVGEYNLGLSSDRKTDRSVSPHRLGLIQRANETWETSTGSEFEHASSVTELLPFLIQK